MKRLLLAGLLHGLLVTVPPVAVAQEPAGSPDILTLAEAGEEANLVEQVSARPDDARAALRTLFERTVQAADSDERVELLDRARRLALAYERAWSDSFLLRRVDQFASWSTGERLERLEADSLRRAGAEVFYREGPEAAMRLWERSLALYRVLDDEAGQATALSNLGAGHYALGDLDRALRYYSRSLELAEAVRDHRTRGTALGNIANVHKDRGEFAAAAELYERALTIRALSGDRRGEAADVNNLGLVLVALGDLRGAEEQFRRALRINREDGRNSVAATNLTNLANLDTRRGRYDEALDRYHGALALRRETGDRQGEALDLQNLGLLHLSWGDYPAALQSLLASLTLLEELGMPLWCAEVRGDIATVRTAMGHLQAARADLTTAVAEAGGDAHLGPALAMQRADLLTELNEFNEAAQLYRQARAGYRRLADQGGEAEAEAGIAYLNFTRGDFDAAEEALSRALRVHQSLGDVRPAAITQMLLGDVRFARGDTAAAFTTYQSALTAYETLDDPVGKAVAKGTLATRFLETGEVFEAEAGYRAALAFLEGQPVGPVRWPLNLGLGLVLREQGRLDEAAHELHLAVDVVETISAGLPIPERRHGYMEDKWTIYSELARTELARGREAAAFEISERMRARQLLDLLARGRTSAPVPELALVRQEENLRRQIAQLGDQLYASAVSEGTVREERDPNTELDELRESLAMARERYRRMLVRLEESRPEYASLISSSVATVPDVQRLLPPGASFIEYLVTEECTIAFVVSRERVVAIELPIDHETLRQLIRFLRGTMGPSNEEELWRTPLRRLYHELIAPLEEAGYLDGSGPLVIAPHAELQYLPFQALLRPGPDGESFLIEHYDVAFIPSASTWVQLDKRNSDAPTHGLLAMAPQPEALAYSEAEVRGISRDDTLATVLVGAPATEGRFNSLAPGSSVIHLATLGELNRRNPLFSYVQLNPDETADGRLEVHEVFGLELNADLIVLSACETGLGSGLRHDVPTGDDWVGLVRAFLYAGARSVVASLWTVDDRATALLMQQLHAGLKDGHSGALSLADAQRVLLREPGYTNPFHWAAFRVTGSVE